jgi:hypothetical protein
MIFLYLLIIYLAEDNLSLKIYLIDSVLYFFSYGFLNEVELYLKLKSK